MADQPTPAKQTPHEKWVHEITEAEKETGDFHNRGRKTVRRFTDERDMMEAQNRWFNIYYANTNIMTAALYAQLPKPTVSRRFKDYEDDVARVAALILQRSITQDLDDPRDTFDSTMKCAVQDRLIPGLAAAWLRLETDTEEVPEQDLMGDTFHPEDGTEPVPPEPLTRITDQRVCVDYVYWQDFIWSPCRVWEERRWVGRKVYMDREALIKRFGKEKGNQVPLDYNPTAIKHGSSPQSTPKNEAVQKAVVYEIWCRESRNVYWLSKGYPELLDEKHDPLRLVGFEPCPRPMLANITTSNTCPRPDYYMIQDQYQELDSLNNRISLLLQACKVVGVYDKSAEGISRMLTEGFDNQLIPVDNWAMFAEKDGLKGNIDWLPLDVVVKAMTELIENRELVKQQIYELTGISDIVRGATKASETLGAQEIKSKFASIAIKKRQDEVAQFAADILRIKAEIQVKHFTPEVLIKKSNIQGTGEANMQFAEQALALLQTEEGFEWRIQITADSIAQADYAMEKADRVEFLTAVSSYLEKAVPMFQLVPGSSALLISMLKWAVAGFKGADEIEGLIDQELDRISKAPPPPPKPDPEQQKMALEKQKGEQSMQIAQQKAELDAQSKQQDLAVKKQLAELEIRMKEMEFQFKIKELQLEEQKFHMEMNFEAEAAARDQRTALMEQQMQLRASAQQHEQSLQQGEEMGAAKLKQAKAAAAAKPKTGGEE